MSVFKEDSKLTHRRGASLPTPVGMIVDVLSPVEMFVNLLFQPERPRNGVQEDIEAARRRQRRR